MMKEKGFQFAEVTHEIEELPGGPKLVSLDFHMNEGPKVKIRRIDFVGNQALSDRIAEAGDEGEQGAAGSCRASPAAARIRRIKFEEDAERVLEYYRDRGYIRAQVGAPEIRVPRTTPATRRRAGSSCACRSSRASATGSATSTFAGNTVVKDRCRSGRCSS